MADAAPLLQLALPGMAAHLREPAVATPLQGVAETLVGFSAALHQDGDDRMSILMLRLALMVRPDLSAARLLAADVLELQQDLAGAIDVLAPVPESDALAPVVRVREAELTARNGQPDQALAMLSALASQIPDSSAPDSEAGDVLRMKATGRAPSLRIPGRLRVWANLPRSIGRFSMIGASLIPRPGTGHKRRRTSSMRCSFSPTSRWC